jgi:hypothetical protein
MKVDNEIKRTIWRSNDRKFENVANSYSPNYVDSIPKNLTKSTNPQSFVVPWQMTKKREKPD